MLRIEAFREQYTENTEKYISSVNSFEYYVEQLNAFSRVQMKLQILVLIEVPTLNSSILYIYQSIYCHGFVQYEAICWQNAPKSNL